MPWREHRPFARRSELPRQPRRLAPPRLAASQLPPFSRLGVTTHSRWLPQSRRAGDLHAIVCCPAMSGTQRLDLAERARAHLGLARGRPRRGAQPSAGTRQGGVCRAGALTGVGTWPGHGVLPCEMVNSGREGFSTVGFIWMHAVAQRSLVGSGCLGPASAAIGGPGADTFQTRVLCDPVVPVLSPRKDLSIHAVALSPC